MVNAPVVLKIRRLALVRDEEVRPGRMSWSDPIARGALK